MLRRLMISNVQESCTSDCGFSLVGVEKHEHGDEDDEEAKE